jgi:FkbM family methyltransferase
MPSKLRRRGGVAVCGITDLLKWTPTTVVQVGVGQNHDEVDVMREWWGDFNLIGFEAHLGIAESIQQRYPGELHAVAVGEKAGTITLHSKRNHKDGTSRFKHANRETHTIDDVPMTTLDEQFRLPTDLGERVLLWLDCEGGELSALRGGERFVQRVAVINLELTSRPPGPGWCDAMETHRWLVKRGFIRQSAHTTRSGSGQCDAVYVRRSMWRPEYCYCPCAFYEVEGLLGGSV